MPCCNNSVSENVCNVIRNARMQGVWDVTRQESLFTWLEAWQAAGKALAVQRTIWKPDVATTESAIFWHHVNTSS